MDVGLSNDLLVDVGLSGDLLVKVGLSRDLLVKVGLSKGVDLASIVVWVDGKDGLSSIGDWGSGVGSGSDGGGSVVQGIGGSGVGGSGVGGSGVGGSGVVQGIGSTSPEEIGGGSGGGSQARENSDLENRQIVFLGKSAITQL